MYIAIRKEPNGSLYMDKYFFNRYNDGDLARYNYKKVEVPYDVFANLETNDFNDDLTFSQDKFDTRIQREEDLKQLPRLQERLKELSEDIVQIQCGAVFEDKDKRIAEFQGIHNEIRRILNKEPRKYLTSN